MKIHIENNLYLESDQYQYLLKQYSGRTYPNKKGEEIESYQVIGYYGSVNQAIKALINKKIKETTATNLTELLNDIKRIEKHIKEKVNV